MAEVVAELSQLARQSPHLNQRSGVSVRLTIANYETLVANATRRALRNGEDEAVPRVSDLQALVSSTQGKVEIESLEEGREEILLGQLVSAAVLLVFRRRVVLDDPQAVIGAFTADTVVHAGDDLPAAAYAGTLSQMPALSAPVLGADRRFRGPRGGGQRGRVPAGGPAPDQAPQQGGRRGQGHVSWARMTWRFDYRRWDGTQDSLIDDTDSVLAQLTDDLLANGDLHEALQRILNRGWETPDGERIQGLRELLDELRLEREEQLDRGDLGGAYREVAEELQQVLAEERTGIEQLQADAQASGDQRRQEVTDEVAAERRMQLDLLPSDLAGTVRGLQNYEFVSSEARQHFEELMEKLREEVAKTYFDQMSEALSNPDPEQLAHMREGFDALNRMIEQREAGEPIDPSFESFMERFGDMFPGNPKDLDELLEQLAAQMAAAQAMWNSMSPEQRSQLQGLAESLLEDLDLRWQVDRLAGNLQRAFPGAGWDQRYRFSGDQPMGMGEGTDAAGRLRDLDELENFLRSATSPAALSEVDLDKVRRHLGDDAAHSLDRLAKLTKQLQDAGLIDQREGRFELTPQGIRRIGQQALADLFGQLTKDHVGQPPHHLDRHRPRPRGDDQALRVRRPVQPRPLPYGPQCRPPGG